MSDPYFEMGVAVRIQNHKFRWPYRAVCSVSGALSAAATTIDLNDTSGIYSQTMQRGDMIILGESSNTSYLGKTETAIIETVAYQGSDITRLTVRSGISNSYANGDVAVVYGSKFANNWGWHSTGSVQRTPMGIKPYGGGYSDDYALFWQGPESKAGAGGVSFSWDTNPFLESTCYRMGFYYKYDVQSSDGKSKVMVHVNDGKKLFLASNPSYVDVLDWTRWTKGSEGTISSPNLVGGNDGSFTIYQYLSTASDYSYLWLDDVFLEHAQRIEHRSPIKNFVEDLPNNPKIIVFDNSEFAAGDWIIVHGYDAGLTGDWMNWTMQINTVSPDGQTIFVNPGADVSKTSTIRQIDGWVEKVSNGHFVFDEVPLRESEDYGRVTKNIILQASPNNLKSFGTDFEDRTHRWWYRCYFSNCNLTMWNKLQKFLWWQERGNLLNFHPIGKTDLPSVMTGFMKISNVTQSRHFSNAYRSFEFYFEEAVV